MTEKPEMSQHEASWHEHYYGMLARAAARKQGENPAATEALASATAGPIELHGFKLHPASQGTVWTLKRSAREFAAWADLVGMPIAPAGAENGTRESLELGISTLVFCDARRVWLMLEKGHLDELIAEAEKLMWHVPLAVTRDLENHFYKQMQAIRDLTPEADDAPGKPDSAGGSGILARDADPAGGGGLAAVEWMCAEYSIPFRRAVWRTSLVVPLILMPVRNERHGGSGGPSYATRASMAARNKTRRFLEEHFTIVKKPVSETGWQLGNNTLKI